MLHIFIIFPTSKWAVFSLWQKWGWTTRNGDFTNPPSEMPPLPSSTAELLDNLSQAGNGSTGVALWCRPGSNLQVFGPRSRSGCAELSAAGTKRTLPWRWCSLAPKIDLQIGWEITGGGWETWDSHNISGFVLLIFSIKNNYTARIFFVGPSFWTIQEKQLI